MKTTIVVVWLSLNGGVQETRETKDWTHPQCRQVATMINDRAKKSGISYTAWCEDAE